MVGYVRWEEKRKRLTLRRCPLGDGEVGLLEGGGRLDRRVQRRVRQAAQAMADAGVRYAAAPPEWAALLLPLRLPAPVALRRAMLGQLVDCACRQLGLCRSQASVVLRASRPDGAVTEAADLLARRVRYLSPQLGRGQEELRRSLRHRYGLGEGGPAAQLAVCFGAAAEGLPSLLIGESHQEVRYVWTQPWWEKMKPWAAEEPLLTAAQYERKGQPMPTVSTLVQASVDRYAQQSTAAQAARKNGGTGSDTAADMADLAQRADDLQAITDSLLASTDKLLAGLTDVAGSTSAAEADLNKGAEGSLPEQTVTVDQIKTSATPAPTEPPADSAAADGTTPDPTAAPTEAPQPDNSGTGETINVTMNGTAQTMDLVQCLAMVAQNELGPNAPAEAYKAQCVATHCWIISQSGYPSVLGAEPGAAALAAAQEVAHVLVTYNGQVCFTPYFASASTGTASAAEVWGNDRAWLQAVDSPYDQSVSSHWNTNGNSSGTARFSRQTLQDRIRDVMDIDLSGVDPNSWFTIQSANQYGWVAKIQVGPDAGVGTVSGRWFRENLLARQSVDGRSLRSQCFTVSYNADLDCFIFDVYGYGHGCGMSQWGAIGYARNGWGYQDILTHYFVGTTITTY